MQDASFGAIIMRIATKGNLQASARGGRLRRATIMQQSALRAARNRIAGTKMPEKVAPLPF
jgi:hypothetical protein